jgi:hypothetical protein
VDAETNLWPVPPHLTQELDRIKYDFTVNPLPVYKNEQFVPAAALETCLHGALVEVTFNLEHYAIFKQNETPHDSFDADILQINILEDGEETPLSLFKLHDVHKGPIKLQKRGFQLSSAEEPVAKKVKKGDSDKVASTSKSKEKQVDA